MAAGDSIMQTEQRHPHTPTPASSRQSVHVDAAVLDRLARISSGSLTTQLFRRGLRQPVLVGFHYGTKMQSIEAFNRIKRQEKSIDKTIPG